MCGREERAYAVTDTDASLTFAAVSAPERASGFGLGLSIVKAIADAHDATLTADAPAEVGLRIEIGFRATD
jgi:K+-sensing histidine kinase KdpD